jgi:predicted kinase
VSKSTLYIFSGLPASGKSTLARELAHKTNPTFIRIDTIEQGLRDVCKMDNIEGEGYRLSYLIAKDNLNSGNNVIADSVNPWELTRKEWNDVATSVGSEFVNIEVICSDKQEHKNRVETRNVGIENLKMPTWEEVLNRDYHQWTMPRIVIDTAGKTIEASVIELLSQMN